MTRYTLSSRRAKTLAIFAAVALPFVVLPFFMVDMDYSDHGIVPDQPERIFKPTQVLGVRNRLMAAAYSYNTTLSQIRRSPHIGYDISVIRAMEEMGLAAGHFDAWIDEHPSTALVHVKYMPVNAQRYVASTASFIRKSNPRIDAKTAWREAAALVHYSAKYAVPYALTTAVAQVESTFDPNAVSPKGASGVMQVMWRLHKHLLSANGIMPTPGANPLSDPEQAIAAGCLLISRYIRAYGSVQDALEKYYGTSSVTYQRKVNRNIASIMNHHSEFFK
ncbi:MAG: lytic transglycosylase domain-containing protein [Synergistaceae bacterium]|nr:lytic transglycosylase domain-containing protein [Synergistaceae bacterium]